ncbi:5608_t:CDS:2, partial [Cetraspora pellucida]
MQKPLASIENVLISEDLLIDKSFFDIGTFENNNNSKLEDVEDSTNSELGSNNKDSFENTSDQQLRNLPLSYVLLLHELFPEATIVDYDVKNYVYKFWHIHLMHSGDAVKLFEHFKKEHQTIKATEVQPGAFIIDADSGFKSVVPK